MLKTTTWLAVATVLATATAVLATACQRPTRPGGEVGRSNGDRQFTVDLLLPTTPVKQQGKSELCWVYAMLATIETERLALGDSVNLSPVFTARRFLAEQAERYYLSQGRTSLSLRGMMTMTLRLINQYGLQPYDYYHGYENVNWSALARRVQQLADEAIDRRTGLGTFREQLGDLLDKETGFAPRYVHMLGAEYTNEQFGRSVCMPGDYVALTSFSHHPYGERFVLEVADNQACDAFLNVPPDSLMNVIRHALLSRHPVCWEGDISEPGFSFSKGFAAYSDSSDDSDYSDDSDHSSSLRQRLFEQFQTTDDHCMALVGLAHDRQGRRYFIAKNSWGTKNPYGGLMFLSEDYVLLKTICIALPRIMLTAP